MKDGRKREGERKGRREGGGVGIYMISLISSSSLRLTHAHETIPSECSLQESQFTLLSSLSLSPSVSTSCFCLYFSAFLNSLMYFV